MSRGPYWAGGSLGDIPYPEPRQAARLPRRWVWAAPRALHSSARGGTDEHYLSVPELAIHLVSPLIHSAALCCSPARHQLRDQWRQTTCGAPEAALPRGHGREAALRAARGLLPRAAAISHGAVRGGHGAVGLCRPRFPGRSSGCSRGSELPRCSPRAEAPVPAPICRSCRCNRAPACRVPAAENGCRRSSPGSLG